MAMTGPLSASAGRTDLTIAGVDDRAVGFLSWRYPFHGTTTALNVVVIPTGNIVRFSGILVLRPTS